MKAASIFLMIIMTFGCKDIVNLNNQIYEAQKQAVLKSPYKSAFAALAYIDAQKDFRLNTLRNLRRNKIFSRDVSRDTIFITEAFDELCLNCPSYSVKILLKDTVYSTEGTTYEVEREPFYLNSNDFEYKLRNSDIIEIASKVKKGEPWTTNPLQYGTDGCYDGDHTIATVIYPNGEIEALYVRCWTPSFDRRRK